MVIQSSAWNQKYALLVVCVLVGITLNLFHQTQYRLDVGTSIDVSAPVITRTNDVEQHSRPRRDCTWAPDKSDECQEMVSQLITKHGSFSAAIGRRFLVFGDSTMGPSFLFKYLSPQLVETPSWEIPETFCKGRYQCEMYIGRRCHLNHLYHLDYPKDMEWRPPGFGVGPREKAPFCTECNAGCITKFLQCNITNSSHPCRENTPALQYGGYMAIECAKDAEMQSTEYLTTQENILHYIRREWNTPELVHDFGKPICFVNTGCHDVKVGAITREIFLENVQWYLGLLRMACSYVFWINTNAPLQEVPTPGIPQTVNLTRYWNDGVRQLIATTAEYQSAPTVAYIDIFEVSLLMSHHDNVHMGPEFYSSLASLIVPNSTITSFR